MFFRCTLTLLSRAIVPERLEATGDCWSNHADLGFNYFFGILASLDMFPHVYVGNCRVVEPPTRTILGREGTAFYRAGPTTSGFVPKNGLPTLIRKAVSFIDQHAVAFVTRGRTLDDAISLRSLGLDPMPLT